MSAKDLEVLGSIVEATDMLSPRQKNFLHDNLGKLKPLEILKLKHSLVNKFQTELSDFYKAIFDKLSVNQQDGSSVSLTSLKNLKLKKTVVRSIQRKPHPRARPPIQRNPQKEQIQIERPKAEEKPSQPPVSESVLTNEKYLAQVKPVALNEPSDKLHSLSSIVSLAQLNQLNASHIDFLLDDNVNQILLEFFAKLEKMFANFKDIRKKRSYLMTFLQSPLFSSYMNTGLTAFRHPEITPSSTRLNTLHKTNEQYLGKKQFQYAALISHHIRNLAVV